MAQDISLLGAVYSDVPSVLLPKQGGGTAQFDDTTDADATASDILSGKTAYVNGVKITGTGTGGGGSVTQDQDGFIVLPPTGGGGGGVTNVVQGTFTTGNTTGASSFTIPYSGSGYPIMLLAYVNGGIWNNTSGGDSSWYALAQRYAIGSFMIQKQETNTEPTYLASTSLTNNLAFVYLCHKNSDSDSTAFSFTGGKNIVSFNGSNATSSQNDVMKFKNGTTVSYYVATSSSSRGLASNTTYAYIAVYSS